MRAVDVANQAAVARCGLCQRQGRARAALLRMGQRRQQRQVGGGFFQLVVQAQQVFRRHRRFVGQAKPAFDEAVTFNLQQWKCWRIVRWQRQRRQAATGDAREQLLRHAQGIGQRLRLCGQVREKIVQVGQGAHSRVMVRRFKQPARDPWQAFVVDRQGAIRRQHAGNAQGHKVAVCLAGAALDAMNAFGRQQRGDQQERDRLRRSVIASLAGLAGRHGRLDPAGGRAGDVPGAAVVLADADGLARRRKIRMKKAAVGQGGAPIAEQGAGCGALLFLLGHVILMLVCY